MLNPLGFQKKAFFDGQPVVVAPLAGITDAPMRVICLQHGADLCYVEMISATALLYQNVKTLAMLYRGEREPILGVQLAGRTDEEIARAIALLDKSSFETIDINMGCPVAKVVGPGGGSSMIKDPALVYRVCKLAREATDKPLSIKIRIGWDRSTFNALEVADAAQSAGMDWITVHGRTRSEGYAIPVDLGVMAEVKRHVTIPVIGNGNIFSAEDASTMRERTGVDGLMLARGILGNPWLIQTLKGPLTEVTIEAWHEVVLRHLALQKEHYADDGFGASCRMRKQLIWYATGWPGVRVLREKINSLSSLDEAMAIIDEFVLSLKSQGIFSRPLSHNTSGASRFREQS